MRRLRHRLVQRLVAAVLLAGLGAAWMPTAEARADRADARALVAGLDAAVSAQTLDAAAQAFADAYVAHGGTAGDALAAFDALVADGFGAPDPLAEAFVPGRLAAPTPPTRVLSALWTSSTPGQPLAAAPARPSDTRSEAPASPRRSPRSPRAP